MKNVLFSPLLVMLISVSIPVEGQISSGKSTKIEPGDQPKLVVAIVVDQMRYDYLEMYWNLFGDEGFKRLVREGYSFTNQHFNYFPTYTGPGHVSIFSGATPSVHGAVGNDWYDRKTGRYRYVVEDQTVESVGTSTDAGKYSPVNILSTTVTDELKTANKHSKVITVGLKDRSAISTAGHLGDAAYWFENGSGHFISSSWYMENLPEWVVSFNEKERAQKFIKMTWEPLLPEDQYTRVSGINGDASPYERPFSWKDRPVFPYNLGHYTGNSFSLVKNTPFGNTLVTEFARKALEHEQLGADRHTDFLVINYGATDYIGHDFGPHSIEVADAFARLDRELGGLFKELDTRLGKENYLVFLTSDHGTADIPSERIDRGLPAGYFDSDEAIDSLETYLDTRYGQGEWVEAYINQQVYLNRALIGQKGLSLIEMESDAVRFLRSFEDILSANTAFNYLNNDYTGGLEELYQNGFMYKRSGDVFIQLKPGWLDRSSRTGTTHGSPYNYDTHVPLLFMGKGIPHGANSRRTEITQIAPTLSRLLHIPFPDGTAAKVLEF